MGYFLILIRLPLIVIHIVLGLIILIFFPTNNLKLKPVHHKISQIWMKILSLLFGFNVIQLGSLDNSADIFISNHVTLFDIIILQSIVPVNFVAKSEIKNWPIIGHLSSKTGTIFINRGDVSDNEEVINTIKKYIQLKKKVVIFPEGRIGDGLKIKKFHSKLLESISNTGDITQPVFIHYPINYPIDNQNDIKICWADKSQTLIKIAIRCISKLRTDVIIKFHEPIECNQDAYTLAKKSFEVVKLSRDEITTVD